ncbi:MAG: DUF4878 domain-containing protein [Lentimicrobiaceae bacterium]|nr:DUF4878 domain-containing protein [Lentimicrobiaceae bacterium]
MRKLSVVGLLTMMMVGTLLISCGGGKSSPSKAAMAFTENVEKGNYDAAISMLEGAENATAEEKEKMKAFLKEGAKEIEEKGGISNKEILSEEVSEDGKTAKVKMKITYGDGSTDESDTSLVNTDNGWKLKMSK